MVGSEGDGHRRSRDDLTFADDGALLGGADGKDADFGGIHNRAEFADAKGAEVTDRERCAGHFILLELLSAGAIDQVGGFGADVFQAQIVDAAEDGDDEAFGDGDGDAEVDVAEAGDFGRSLNVVALSRGA